MVLEVGEGDAPPRTPEECLVAVIPVQEQLRRQIGLIEHDYVRSLLADEPVQVPLLLLRVDTPHIPHQDCQWDLGDTQVATRHLLVMYFV